MSAAASDLNAVAVIRFRWSCLLLAGLVILFATLLGSDLPPTTRHAISGVGLLSGGVVAAICCGFRSRRSSGRRSRAWLFLATGSAIAAVGNILAMVAAPLGMVSFADRFGDVAYVAALLLGICGLVTFPSVPRRRTDVTRMVLDGVVLGGSILFIVSVTVFPQLLEENGTPISQAIVLSLPILDVVLSTLAVFLIMRSSRADRPALALVSAGFLLYAVADMAFAVFTAHQPFEFGTLVDLGWIAGYGLIGLAALKPSEPVDHHEPAEVSPVFGTVLMFVLFLSAAVASLVQLSTARSSVILVVMWLGVLLAVASRQVLLVIDNDALRQGLERRVAERTGELRQMTRQSELLLSSVGDGIYGVDRSGWITFVNPAGAAVLGFRADQLIGRHAHSVFHSEEPDGSGGCNIAAAIHRRITTVAEETQYRRANGRIIPVEVTASPLTGDHQIEGAVVVFRDITQRREVDKMKGEFVSMVSHELRTPLTSIRGSLGLLSGGAFGELPPAMTRMVAIALQSTERLTRLVNDILDIERIEAGMMPLELADHETRTLIESAAAQMQGLAAQADISVVIKQTPGRVHADSDRVIQTLINLLGNSIKFSPAGARVEISTRRVRDQFEFAVSDNGPGIPDDQLDLIFERFQQGDSSDARGRSGSGLGLAISRSIIERHGGRIWASNNASAGATFFFTLPEAEHPSS